MLVYLHILMGAFALISGITAFSAQKGASLHKKSGLIFVITMLIMSSTGAFLAALNGEKLNIVAGCLTFYLVATAFLVVHPFKKRDRLYNTLLMVFGLIVGVSGMIVAASILNDGGTKIDGQPTQVLVVFSAIALLASVSDLRIVFSNRLKGKKKFIRHIWRMGIAMFMAAASFFLGQSQVIPEEIRTMAFLVTPVLLVLLLTLYWAVRVQFWGLKKRT
jgi:uncharacterized membrane protein